MSIALYSRVLELFPKQAWPVGVLADVGPRELCCGPWWRAAVAHGGALLWPTVAASCCRRWPPRVGWRAAATYGGALALLWPTVALLWSTVARCCGPRWRVARWRVAVVHGGLLHVSLVFCRLPFAFCMSLTSCLLLLASRLLHASIVFCLWPFACVSCLLPFAFASCGLPFAFLPYAFCLLPFAFCFLPLYVVVIFMFIFILRGVRVLRSRTCFMKILDIS